MRRPGHISRILLAGLLLAGVLLSAMSFAEKGESRLDQIEDPFLRPKNGPPLTDIVNKVDLQWLYGWLKNPSSHDPTARMPNLQLDDAEIRAIISYLNSIATPMATPTSWGVYLLTDEDEWSDADWLQLDQAISRGDRVWRRSRCSICHLVEGRGGFVDLKVGRSLNNIAGKMNREWLFQWIKDPQSYFPETLMPRYRLTDDEIKDLVVNLTYGDSFVSYDEENESIEELAPSTDSVQIALGKRAIELSRCILCHDIEGIPEIMPVERQQAGPSGGFYDLLKDIRCLTCHRIAGKGGDYAPELTFEGSKLRTGWISNFLASPDIIRPLSQQMPQFNMTDEEVETAAHFIKGNLLRSEMNQDPGISLRPTSSEIEVGENIYYTKGCFGCHAIEGEGGAVGPDLTGLRSRLEPAYIFFHLKYPNRAVPFSPEPDYDLTDEEARSLAHFLLSI